MFIFFPLLSLSLLPPLLISLIQSCPLFSSSHSLLPTPLACCSSSSTWLLPPHHHHHHYRETSTIKDSSLDNNSVGDKLPFTKATTKSRKTAPAKRSSSKKRQIENHSDSVSSDLTLGDSFVAASKQPSLFREDVAGDGCRHDALPSLHMDAGHSLEESQLELEEEEESGLDGEGDVEEEWLDPEGMKELMIKLNGAVSKDDQLSGGDLDDWEDSVEEDGEEYLLEYEDP